MIYYRDFKYKMYPGFSLLHFSFFTMWKRRMNGGTDKANEKVYFCNVLCIEWMLQIMIFMVWSNWIALRLKISPSAIFSGIHSLHRAVRKQLERPKRERHCYQMRKWSIEWGCKCKVVNSRWVMKSELFEKVVNWISQVVDSNMVK